MQELTNRRVFSFELDILKIGNKPISIGKVKQLDGTSLNIDLKNGEFPINLSDSIIRLFFKRPDGRAEFQKVQVTIVDEKNGRITIDCIDEIFEINGNVTLEVEIVNLHGYIETTPEFTIEVIDKIGDETDREIIRVEEVTLMQELKDYVVASSAYIDNFKGMLDEITNPNYDTLLSQLIATKETLQTLNPIVENSINTLSEKIQEALSTQVKINITEQELKESEASRVREEEARKVSESIRVRDEDARKTSEIKRESDEEVRRAAEINRKASEEERVISEDVRIKAEEAREQNEADRGIELKSLRTDLKTVSDIVDSIPKDGNYEMDIVVKGNIFPTVDGIKPELTGPQTKDAGNVILPYARAVGGLTKDKRGVRTIGFVAKPMDANPSLDITEEQNTDSVFLGTDVSQLFIYSKEKYPTIVSQGELSPIATQDWVMRLVEGLGLLKGEEDTTPTITSSVPSQLFNLELTNSWSSVMGTWLLNDENKAIMLPDGQRGLYKPIIANSNINEVSFISGGRMADASNDIFIGLWKTNGYIYGCRIKGNTLNISCFGTNGVRGGANTFTIRETVKPGDILTLHYNFSNDIWEIYKFDANNEPVLVYQMSKFMMSGFPEFFNGRDVSPTLSMLVNGVGGVEFVDCPNPAAIKNQEVYSNYVF